MQVVVDYVRSSPHKGQVKGDEGLRSGMGIALADFLDLSEEEMEHIIGTQSSA